MRRPFSKPILFSTEVPLPQNITQEEFEKSFCFVSNQESEFEWKCGTIVSLNYTTYGTVIVLASTNHFTRFALALSKEDLPPETSSNSDIFFITIEIIIGFFGAIAVLLLILVAFIAFLIRRKRAVNYSFQLGDVENGNVYLTDGSIEVGKKLGQGGFG